MDGNGFSKEISDSFTIDINNDSSVIHPHTIDNLIMENTASGDNSLVCKVSGQIGGDVSTIDHINLGIILRDSNGSSYHQQPGLTLYRQDISENGYFEKSLEFFNLDPPLLDYSPSFLGAVIVNSDGHLNKVDGQESDDYEYFYDRDYIEAEDAPGFNITSIYAEQGESIYLDVNHAKYENLINYKKIDPSWGDFH